MQPSQALITTACWLPIPSSRRRIQHCSSAMVAASASAGWDIPRRRQRRAPSCDASASPLSAMSFSSMMRALPLAVLAYAIAVIPSALGFHAAVSSRVATFACRPLAMRNNNNHQHQEMRSTGSSAARFQKISFSASSPVASRCPSQPSALRMAAAGGGDEKPPSSSSSAAARKATQSLTSPVRKTDRRSPTRIISKPSANARATMTLGGDKIPKSMKKEKSDDTKK